MKNHLPLFYFPSTVCFVDDDNLFLEAAKINFNKNFNFKSYSTPERALNDLKNYEPPSNNLHFTRELIEDDYFNSSTNFSTNLNISSIQNLYRLENRCKELSVLIIDYQMPTLSGLDLFQKLKNLNCKKILLTGEVDHRMAIDAFNLGLIDQFIEKNVNVAEQLDKAINELSYAYFKERSIRLLSHLEASNYSPLSDPTLINFFNEFCKKEKIKEFYLVDSSGTFLCINNNQEHLYFVLMSEKNKQDFLELHDDIDKNTDLLQKVHQNKLIPFFGIGKSSWEVDLNEWNNYFYSAQTIIGDQNYLWAVAREKQ